MKLTSTIESIQRNLGVSVDGRAGPETWKAIGDKLGAIPSPPPSDHVDARSERNIATLLPQVQSYARALVHASADVGIDIKVISGTRTYDEQNALYAIGRTISAPRTVTNAKGGFSNHNFGIAFDIGVFEGNNYLGESAKYKTVGALGIQLGLFWGGSWQSFRDEPHFELKPTWAKDMSESEMVAELRKRHEAKVDVFA